MARESPTFKKYPIIVAPGDELLNTINEKKRDVAQLKMQVQRGKKRDSINQDDYEKIINLRTQKIELSEYVQKDQLRKEVTDIVNHQKYLKLGQYQPPNKSVS